MIFCAPISSLELGEEVGVFFFVSVPTFIFPCPRKNSCVGREKNIPGQRRELITTILQKSILLIP